MATSFKRIYRRFLQKVDDPVFAEMSNDDVMELFNGWLMTSIAKIRELKLGGFELNEDETAFACNLSNLEIEILAMGMEQEYLAPMIDSITLTKHFITTKEQVFFAQHNHLNGLEALYDRVKKEKKQLISRYKTLHNDYLETEEEAVVDGTIDVLDENDTEDDEMGRPLDYNKLINKPQINDVTLQGNVAITGLMNENSRTGEQDISIMVESAFDDSSSSESNESGT